MEVNKAISRTVTDFTPKLSKGWKIPNKSTDAISGGKTGKGIKVFTDSAKTYATEAAVAVWITAKPVHP